ncbi:MAG: DUF6970 domain-containing protein [Chitinophagales bacterium]
MKSLLLAPMLLLLLDAKSCEQKNDSQLPPCIQSMITDYKNRPVKGPSAKFYEYDYRGKKVYLMEPPCCDQISKLYDDQCNLLCSSGGFAGKVDSVCRDFFLNRKNEKLIWEDSTQKKL